MFTSGALALGDVWALDQLWRELGFDDLGAIFRRARYTTPVEQALRVMVFNRLCDPDSKLGVLRWLQTVSIPGIDTKRLTHQHLLRSMDVQMDHQGAVDECVAALLRPLIDVELSVVFYDLTTIRTEGLSEQSGDVRQYGMSKEGLIARQFTLSVVQTADGMPIYHEVFAGNTSEAPTLQPTLRKVLARFPHIRRLIVVADRGLLSLDNIGELSKVEVTNAQSVEFILAVPGRRYGDFEEILQPLQEQAAKTPQEFVAYHVAQHLLDAIELVFSVTPRVVKMKINDPVRINIGVDVNAVHNPDAFDQAMRVAAVLAWHQLNVMGKILVQHRVIKNNIAI